MGKRIVSVLLCALLLCLCAGCGSYKADASFTYLLEQNVTSLDPQTASNSAAELVISSLFEGLCRIDEDGEAIPGVARSWEANSDSTEFTFHLRRNAQWSDGTPLTAQDFVYGITRALSPATGSTPGDLLLIRGAKSFAAGEGDASTLGVVAEDEHTLIIRLEKSNPDFPALTAGAHYMPCSQAYFESCQGHYGLSSQYLLTNGPFTFGSAYAWQTDSGKRSITVSRSDTYRGERRVQAASVTFLIDYDEAYETDPVTALTSGEVDILTLTETQAQQAQEAGCGVMALDDAVTGLLLNPASDKLSDATLRSLFFKTLNRQDLLAQRGDAVEAQGIMPACVLCADDPESVAVVNTFLAAWNSALGNAFNLERVSPSTFQSRIASGNYEAALFTLRAGGTSPYDVLKSFESTAVPALLESPEYDQALESLTFDLASYQTAEQLLQEQYVFYPIFQDKTYYATSPDTRGITVAPDQSVSFIGAKKR